jgi:hypothetical protein
VDKDESDIDDVKPSEDLKKRMSQSSIAKDNQSERSNTESNITTIVSEEKEKISLWKRIIKKLNWVVESRVFEIFTIIITL